MHPFSTRPKLNGDLPKERADLVRTLLFLSPTFTQAFSWLSDHAALFFFIGYQFKFFVTCESQNQ